MDFLHVVHVFHGVAQDSESVPVPRLTALGRLDSATTPCPHWANGHRMPIATSDSATTPCPHPLVSRPEWAMAMRRAAGSNPPLIKMTPEHSNN